MLALKLKVKNSSDMMMTTADQTAQPLSLVLNEC